MRPRVFPAEDLRGRGLADESRAGFNEAAGIPRGRRRGSRGRRACRQRFNEAAGIPRGRLTSLIVSVRSAVALQ